MSIGNVAQPENCNAKQRNEKEQEIEKIKKGLAQLDDDPLYQELIQGIRKQQLDAVTDTLKKLKKNKASKILKAFENCDGDKSYYPYDDPTLAPLAAAIARVIGEPVFHIINVEPFGKKAAVIGETNIPPYSENSQAIVIALIKAMAPINSRSVFVLLCRAIDKKDELFREFLRPSDQTQNAKSLIQILNMQKLSKSNLCAFLEADQKLEELDFFSLDSPSSGSPVTPAFGRQLSLASTAPASPVSRILPSPTATSSGTVTPVTPSSEKGSQSSSPKSK